MTGQDGEGLAARPAEQPDGHHDVPFAHEQRPEWDHAINAMPWQQPAAGFKLYVKSFDCPRCGDRTQVEYYLPEHPAAAFTVQVQTVPGPQVIAGDVVLIRDCACESTHSPGTKGCGARFHVRPPRGAGS
ncbi:hypothetical protein [Deinococcus sonorensis]|uniref:Uncharacterized protein n=2 Tax=Deinococcus sonorensis TaxID=309891 RepID=A0AAU7UFS0_9DEIO